MLLRCAESGERKGILVVDAFRHVDEVIVGAVFSSLNVSVAPFVRTEHCHGPAVFHHAGGYLHAVFVTVNYLHEQLEKHFAEPKNGVKIDCIKEPQFLGTMGATQFVTKFYNDVVLVMNSDLFTNIDYEDFYLHFMEHNADMSVAAVPYSISVPYGIFELDGRNIKGVKEKPVYNYFANAGIYLIKRELLDAMPKNTFYNATDLMNDAVTAGKTVIRYPITGYWLDIGSHEEYKKANELVKHIKK